MNTQEYIRNIASHYPDSDSIQRILQFASVDIINVDLEGKPLNIWFMAMQEVISQNRLPDLIQTISAEYPGLKINEEDQKQLKKFVSKKIDSRVARPGFFSSNRSDLLKIGFVLLLVIAYIIFIIIIK